MHSFDPVALGEALFLARSSGVAVARPPAMDKTEATLVKRHVLTRLSGSHALPCLGYKVSMSGTWGALYEGAVLESPATIYRAALFDPLIETEAVFRLDADIDCRMTTEDVVACTRVSAGIEVADCRFDFWCPSDPRRLTLPLPSEIEADNALAALMIIDDRAVPAAALPLPDVMVSAFEDGRPRAQGKLDQVMGHPAEVVLWLARALAEDDERLRAGQFVSTGNPFPDFITVPRGRATTFRADIAGVGSARLTVR